MFEFLGRLFDTSGFPPRWECGTWTAGHGWLHILSDLGVWSAYTAIPMVLAYFILRRSDLPLPRIFWLFAVFILACGLTHLLEAVIFWQPIYRFAGLMKLLTALVSWATVLALIPAVPVALSFRSPVALEAEVAQRTAELREREAQVRALVEASPAGILTLDAGGRITGTNPAFERLFGATAAQLRGRPAAELFAVADLRAHGLHETSARRPGGGKFPVSLSVAAFPHGGQGHFVVAVHDLSAVKEAERERRDLEARLQHAQKLESLALLAGGVAHDFNNLLVAMLGHAEIALDALPADAPARANLLQIRIAARRAAERCEQMFAVSGKGKTVAEPCDLSHMAAETVDLLAPSLGTEIAVERHLPTDLPPAEGDPTQLRQVVLNLLTNAADAISPAIGTVTVATSVETVAADAVPLAGGGSLPAGEYVVLSVADTGCGMDAATAARIFEPFFTTKQTGRGLGLAAVLGILRGHGGGLRVVSEPGRGTRFDVLLPRGHRPVAADTATATHADISGGVALVIDDEPGVRQVARVVLEAAGFEVVCAAGGPEGLALFDQAPGVRFVLLDLTMPGMHGADVFRELRRRRPDLPVLMSSGFSEREAAALTGQGRSAFLKKPYRRQEITDAVARLLGGR